MLKKTSLLVVALVLVCCVSHAYAQRPSTPEQRKASRRDGDFS